MFGNSVNNKKRKHLGDDEDEHAELLLTSRKSQDKKGKERGSLKELKESERERQARKQVREKRKRLAVAASIELLTDKLLKVDRGTNFFRHNNQIYFGRGGASDKKSSNPSEVKNVLPRERYGGYLSSSFNENNRPLNRTEIITYATKMIKRLSEENEELKVKQLTLEYNLLQKAAMSGQEPRRNFMSVQHAGTHITRPQDQNYSSNPAGTLQSPFVLAHEQIASSSPAAMPSSTMSFAHLNPMISSNINQVIYNQAPVGGGIYCSSGLNQHVMSYNDNLVGGSLATVNASPFQSLMIQQPGAGAGPHRQLYY